MIVVSNTSPVLNLAAVGWLDLLHQLYGQVLVPQAVWDEITIVGRGQSGAIEVETSDWVEARQVMNRPGVALLQLELDKGEAEAIALAVELQADLLLLDERKGRAVASRLGLRFIGLLGLLMEAKCRGLVSAVQPVLDDLIVRAGFWISQELYRYILEAAGE